MERRVSSPARRVPEPALHRPLPPAPSSPVANSYIPLPPPSPPLVPLLQTSFASPVSSPPPGTYGAPPGTYGAPPPIGPPYASWRPPGQAVGWGAVENAVRDFDEQQVKDCKEDIDTLLTFAGLFSAALTALLALSYAQLQEDTVGESLLLLRQISNQTAVYIISQGSLSNTISSLPSPPAPFVPSTTAVRVNALWFSSLVCSLATASIGILVKQWLRAYMAFATSSAQGRLRIRHFRRTGLCLWRVFEIAAVLPVLIQLALGLFFVGLCYFTLDADPTVGRATLALIAAWAAFFFLVTVCPVFSAHCPYKTASIEGVLVSVRPYVYRVLVCLQLAVCSLPIYLGIVIRALAGGEPRRLEHATHSTIAWALGKLERLRHPTSPQNEKDVVKSDAVDLTILAAADALQSNDELLGTAILDAVRQSQPHWHTVVMLILQILSNRLPWSGDLASEPTIIDCSPIPQSGRDAILTILSHIPVDQVGPGGYAVMSQDVYTKEKNRAALWAASIVLSAAVAEPPSPALHILGRCLLMSTNMRTSIAQLACLPVSLDVQAEKLRVLLAAAQYVCRDLGDALTCIQDVMLVYLKKLHPPLYRCMMQNFDGGVVLVQYGAWDPRASWLKVLGDHALEDTVTYIATSLSRDLRRNVQSIVLPSAQESLVFTSYRDGLVYAIQLHALMGASYSSLVMGWNAALCNAVRELCATCSVTLVTPLLLALADQPDGALVTSLHWADLRQSLGSHLEGLECLQAAVDNIARSTSADLLGIERLIKLCYILLDVLLHDSSVLEDRRFFLCWRRIFRLLTKMLLASTSAAYEPAKEHRAWVDLWLRWMHHADTGERFYTNGQKEALYAAWRGAFAAGSSPFPDGFVAALMAVHPGKRPYWRVRRLREMSPEEYALAVVDVDEELGMSEEDGVVHEDTVDVLDSYDAGAVEDPVELPDGPPGGWTPLILPILEPNLDPIPEGYFYSSSPKVADPAAVADQMSVLALPEGVVELVDGYPTTANLVREIHVGEPRGPGIPREGRVVMIRYDVREGSVAIYRN